MPKRKDTLVSVIIPLLNASEDVADLFQHLASQNNINPKEFEIIVVDDGSSDDTAALVAQNGHLFSEFGAFKTMTHKERLGLAQTRFDGARAASGKYVTFVDKRTRPDADYFYELVNKKRNIVIGNVYMDKSLSPWDRLLVLIRKKLYYPYFNHKFDDIDLDYKAYKQFKNKGGGGVMLVLREYYLRIATTLKKGKDVNDDSMLIEELSKIEPILKSSTPKVKYLNRTGFMENVQHVYNRGPKFVDYYINPGTRFFIPLVLSALFLIGLMPLAIIMPSIVKYVLVLSVGSFFLVCLYLSEEPQDFVTLFIYLPIIALSFGAGITKGLWMKLLNKY